MGFKAWGPCCGDSGSVKLLEILVKASGSRRFKASALGFKVWGLGLRG